MNTTIRPVMAGQTAQPAVAEQQLLYLKQYVGTPNTLIYAIAGAPYYNLGGTTSNSATLTTSDIFTAFQTDLTVKVLPSFKSVSYNGGKWQNPETLKGLADYYGIKNISYEGGPDYLQNKISLPVKIQSNFDAQMGTQLTSYLNQWFGCGNDLFMFFTLSSAYGQFGNWGLTNDIKSLTGPKYQALKAIANTPPSSFTTCQ
jgi:hypothetical protein